MARLSAFAARFGRKARILRKTTLLVRYALTAFAAGLRSQLTVLREAAFFAGNALAAFSTGLCSKLAILREAAFRIRHRLAAHAGDLALPFLVHRGKTAIRCATFLSPSVSHYFNLLTTKCSGP